MLWYFHIYYRNYNTEGIPHNTKLFTQHLILQKLIFMWALHTGENVSYCHRVSYPSEYNIQYSAFCIYTMMAALFHHNCMFLLCQWRFNVIFYNMILFTDVMVFPSMVFLQGRINNVLFDSSDIHEFIIPVVNLFKNHYYFLTLIPVIMYYIYACLYPPFWDFACTSHHAKILA